MLSVLSRVSSWLLLKVLFREVSPTSGSFMNVVSAQLFSTWVSSEELTSPVPFQVPFIRIMDLEHSTTVWPADLFSWVFSFSSSCLNQPITVRICINLISVLMMYESVYLTLITGYRSRIGKD